MSSTRLVVVGLAQAAVSPEDSTQDVARAANPAAIGRPGT